MGLSIDQMVRLGLIEAFRRKWTIVLIFTLLAGAGTALGMAWPKTFESSVSIYVEEQNIIDPLMEGRAVRAEVSEVATNAREIINNRSFIMTMLDRAGSLTDDMTAREEEALLQGARDRLTVSTPAPNLIRIDYSAPTAREAYEKTRITGELFIEQMLASKERESEAAFRFIDEQVRKYEVELERTQRQKTALVESNPLAHPGSDEVLNTRLATLRSLNDDLEQQLREAEIREQALSDQLSGEAEVSAIASRAEEYRADISELQARLETLRLSYRETYPDIVQLKQQIADLRSALAAEESAEQTREGPAAAPSMDNPVALELRQSLYETRIDIRTIRARISENEGKLARVREQIKAVQELQGEIDKLQRDYEVNQDIYQDLLRRRENARVSRNLDVEQQGLNIRTQSEAYLPPSPAGLGMTHFALGGGVLGVAMPAGLLLLLVVLDPRIRTAGQLPLMAQEMLLGSIPHARSRREKRRAVLSGLAAALVLAAVVAGLIGLMWLRATGRIEL